MQKKNLEKVHLDFDTLECAEAARKSIAAVLLTMGPLYMENATKMTKGIIVLFYIIYIYNNHQVFCEQVFSDPYAEIKNDLFEVFSTFIKQENFIILYNSRFYDDVILNPLFIKKFINSLDWQYLLSNKINTEENRHLIKNEILEEFFKNFVISLVPKIPKYYFYYTEYTNFAEHFFDTSIQIRTPGFEQHLSRFKYEITQEFIKEGFMFNLTFEEGITLTISWYNYPFIKKKILQIFLHQVKVMKI